MRIVPMGDAGLLVEVDGLDEVLALDDALRAAPPAGVLDVVPAARTVLLVLEPGTDLAATRRAVQELDPADPPAPGAVIEKSAAEGSAAEGSAVEGSAVEIEVRYDGPDLEEVGRLTGLGADGVVAAHTGTPWRVAFGGFAPGFAYLAGGDRRLTVARRAEPRTTVPAGAVGLAGEFSGVYPRPSPGGWQLIGSTEARLWSDTDGALLRPGGTVRFRAAR